MTKTFKNSISRLVAVQVLYLFYISGDELEKRAENIDKALAETVENISKDMLKHVNQEFIKRLLETLFRHAGLIDSLIVAKLTKKDSMVRLNALLRSIVECAVCELLYFESPHKVVINEYVKITTGFFAEGETNFVNAILDKIYHGKDA